MTRLECPTCDTKRVWSIRLNAWQCPQCEWTPEQRDTAQQRIAAAHVAHLEHLDRIAAMVVRNIEDARNRKAQA